MNLAKQVSTFTSVPSFLRQLRVPAPQAANKGNPTTVHTPRRSDDPQNVEATLKECFDYLAKSGKRCVVAIDEFQQVAENAYNFGNLLETLPSGSIRLLKAVAAEGKVRELTAGSFMARHGLHANSSVKLSLVKLMDAGLISKNDEGNYLVDDRLFGLWLTRHAI